MNFKQRYNSDFNFKKRVQRASIFFVLFVVIVSVFYATNSNEPNYTAQIDDSQIQIDGNYVPTDTTSFVEDKNHFYQLRLQDSISNAEISIENPLSSIDQTANQNRNINESDQMLDDYLKKREKSVQKMQQSSNNTDYNANRRSYNPYGSSNDYVSVPASNLNTILPENYAENRRQISQTPPEQDTQQPPTQSTQNDGVEVKAKLLSQREYVKSGELLTFVLLGDVVISGVQAKKGQAVTGICQEQQDRLIIQFNTIKIGSKVLNVNMKLFGNDGLEGIAISGSNEKSYSAQKSSEIAQSTLNKVPFVGGIASDAIGTNTKKVDDRIKLTKNISCSIIVY